MAATVILGVVLLAVLIFHAWSARQWAAERTTLVTELTNVAMARSSTELRVLRADPPPRLDYEQLPEGFYGQVGL